MKTSWIVPALIAAVVVALALLLRRQPIPANAPVPAVSTNASGATPNTVPGPTTFAVAAPQLPASPEAMQYALLNPNIMTPPTVQSQKPQLPTFMMLNIPPQRDLQKQDQAAKAGLNTIPQPKCNSCCGGCGGCSSRGNCSASTVSVSDNGSGPLVSSRLKQTLNLTLKSPRILQDQTENIQSVQAANPWGNVHPINLLVQKLNGES